MTYRKVPFVLVVAIAAAFTINYPLNMIQAIIYSLSLGSKLQGMFKGDQ